MPKLFIEITPMGAVRATRFTRNKYTNRYHYYKMKLKASISEDIINEVGASGKIENLTFVLALPKSYSVKKRDSLRGNPHQQTPDLDNLLKGFLDALWSQDSMIHEFSNIRKIWGDVGGIIWG